MVKAILLSSSVLAASAVPALANVDPELHKLCVDARDYAGCIQMQQQGAESLTKLSLTPARQVMPTRGPATAPA